MHADQGGTFFTLDVIKLKPLKEAKSYEDQIQNLIYNHGLKIDDFDRAKEILSSVNYYRLSAYGIGLKRCDDKERYVDGITLDTIF